MNETSPDPKRTQIANFSKICALTLILFQKIGELLQTSKDAALAAEL